MVKNLAIVYDLEFDLGLYSSSMWLEQIFLLKPSENIRW